MTTAQLEALERITELMREHFEEAVLVFQAGVDEVDERAVCRLGFTTSGSYCGTVALLEFARHKLLHDDAEGKWNIQQPTAQTHRVDRSQIAVSPILPFPQPSCPVAPLPTR